MSSQYPHSNKIFIEHIIRNIPQYIFWKDTQSVYVGCNENYAKLLGLRSPHEIVGKTDLEVGWLPDGDSAELFRQGDRQTMEGRLITNQEEWLSLPGGTKILVLVNKSPIIDDSGQVVGVLGIATDITEKKRAERELEEIKNKLEGMTVVGASIAHELRTPLATLSMAASNLKKHFPSLVEAYHDTFKMNSSSQKLKQKDIAILETLPDLMESEAHSSLLFIEMLLMNINPPTDKRTHVFHIAECIRDAFKRYPFKAEQKKLIQLHVEQDFLIRGEKLLIIHVIFNLIKNALYSIAKARKGTISVWLKKEENLNVLYFKDTGTGIDSATLPYIFDRFFTNTHRGAGVGLTFCKMVVDSMGGNIHCESEEKGYTLFIITFPIINED